MRGGRSRANCDLCGSPGPPLQIDKVEDWNPALYLNSAMLPRCHAGLKLSNHLSWIRSDQTKDTDNRFSVGCSEPLSDETWMVHGTQVHGTWGGRAIPSPSPSTVCRLPIIRRAPASNGHSQRAMIRLGHTSSGHSPRGAASASRASGRGIMPGPR